jgi:Protein of unknown function (DUF2958)
MELLPQEIRAKIPKLYHTRCEEDPIAWVKFFSPFFNWRWYIVEFEEVDGVAIFYGWMVSSAEQNGRFIRSDLASMRAYFGITIEYDPQFVPCPLTHIQQEKGES